MQTHAQPLTTQENLIGDRRLFTQSYFCENILCSHGGRIYEGKRLAHIGAMVAGYSVSQIAPEDVACLFRSARCIYVMENGSQERRHFHPAYAWVKGDWLEHATERFKQGLKWLKTSRDIDYHSLPVGTKRSNLTEESLQKPIFFRVVKELTYTMSTYRYLGINRHSLYQGRVLDMLALEQAGAITWQPPKWAIPSDVEVDRRLYLFDVPETSGTILTVKEVPDEVRRLGDAAKPMFLEIGDPRW